MVFCMLGILRFSTTSSDHALAISGTDDLDLIFEDERLSLFHENGVQVSVSRGDLNLGAMVGKALDLDAPVADPATLRRLAVDLEGAWACLAYDSESGQITFAVDRLGYRRFYLYRSQEALFFSTDLGVLARHLEVGEFDLDAITEMIDYRWLVRGKSPIAGVEFLVSATHLTVCGDGSSKRESYWTYPIQKPTHRRHAPSLVATTGDLLRSRFTKLAERYSDVAVSLSGGVDSAIMLALAKEHFKNVTAYTSCWTIGENPELEHAQRFAEHVGARHEIVTLTQADIKRIFYELPQLLHQITRHFSSIPQCAILQAVKPSTDLFLYGEGADLMFGGEDTYQAIYLNKLRLAQTIPPGLRKMLVKFIPPQVYRRSEHIRSIVGVLNDDMQSAFNRISKVYYYTSPHELYDFWRERDGVHQIFPSSAGGEEMHQRCAKMIIETDGLDHLYLLSAMMGNRDYALDSPFSSKQMIEFAGTIHSKLKFGDVFKPILRELGAEFFPRDWMYTPKHGFTTPKLEWMRDIFGEDVEALTKKTNHFVDGGRLVELNVERDYETLWTALSLEALGDMFARERLSR